MLEGALFTVILLAWITWDSYSRKHLTILSPIFPMLVMCTTVLVIRPLHVYFAHDWRLVEYLFFGERPDNWTIFSAFLVADAGIAAYYLAYISLWGRRKANALRLPNLQLSRPMVLAVGLLFTLVGGYSMVRYRPLPMVTGMYDQDFAINAGQFTTTTAYKALAWYSMMGVIFLWAATMRNRAIPFGYMLLFCFAIFYGGWSRTFGVATLLGFVVLELAQRRSRVALTSLALAGPLLLVLLVQIGASRYYLQKVMNNEEVTQAVMSSQWETIGDFEVYLAIRQIVPSKVRYSYGVQVINAFTVAAIPRVIWPEKRYLFVPEDYEDNMQHILRGGRAPAAFGSLYFYGGPVGIIGGLGLLGLISGFLFNVLRRYSHYPYVTVLYAHFFVCITFYWRSGTPDLVRDVLFFPTMPVLLAAGFTWATADLRKGVAKRLRSLGRRTEAMP